MKIVHVCLTGGYTEGSNYQENFLAKYNALAGNDVYIITTEYCWNKGTWGKAKDKNFVNQFGVKVIRIPYRYNIAYKINTYIGKFNGLGRLLDEIQPDFIFIHNLQFLDIKIIRAYKDNHPSVHLVADNHSDFSNSARNALSRNVLYKMYWRRAAQTVKDSAERFYGVLPARVDFLKDIYKLPEEKCELLVMGADDEKVEEVVKLNLGEKIRKDYGVSDDEFLIMTGGKIDAWKKQTLLLMDAVAKIDNPKVKLLVFGSVDPELKNEFEKRCIKGKIIYAGWLDADVTYSYVAASDLMVFPGRHSVFWEQVCGQGKPMLVKYWEGTTHVDLGGNVEFLDKDSVEEIYEKIMNVLDNPDKYRKMKEVAKKKGMETFSYMKIAERSIEV